MPFGAFGLIILFYIFVGIRVVRDVWVRRREAFDRQFTLADRQLVDQAAFFLLVPISVALHELGHAVAIWSFGGHVVGFGYYVFAGYVSYDDPFTKVQHVVVAAAGTIVNVLLCALALAAVFLRRPPMRAAINELLFQFAVVSGVNALIFYPLLDFATGMEGDWKQMYDGGVPALSLAIFVIHAGILILAFVAWRSPGFQRRLAERTGVPAGAERRPFGGLRPSATAPMAPAAPTETPASFEPASPAEARFRAAADRVARGWPQPVQGRIERRDEATQVALVWVSGGAQRAVAMRHDVDGPVRLIGAVVPTNGRVRASTTQRELRRWPDLPDENDLTMGLRMAMEVVDGWDATSAASEGAPVERPV
jgi:hypothetical protein